MVLYYTGTALLVETLSSLKTQPSLLANYYQDVEQKLVEACSYIYSDFQSLVTTVQNKLELELGQAHVRLKVQV